jgi:excisionase family DNA binding protein
MRRLAPGNLRKATQDLSGRRAGAVTWAMDASTSPRLGLTVSQAAAELGVSVATIRRWENAGHLTGYRTPGGQRRFTHEQLDAFMASLKPRG